MKVRGMKTRLLHTVLLHTVAFVSSLLITAGAAQAQYYEYSSTAAESLARRA